LDLHCERKMMIAVMSAKTRLPFVAAQYLIIFWIILALFLISEGTANQCGYSCGWNRPSVMEDTFILPWKT